MYEIYTKIKIFTKLNKFSTTYPVFIFLLQIYRFPFLTFNNSIIINT